MNVHGTIFFFFSHLKKKEKKNNDHILVNKYKFQQDGHPSDNNGINTSNTNTAKHLPLACLLCG